jgi:uncharacterized membrane-anchored protein YhcB (DUF1043 family)
VADGAVTWLLIAWDLLLTGAITVGALVALYQQGDIRQQLTAIQKDLTELKNRGRKQRSKVTNIGGVRADKDAYLDSKHNERGS